ncbi:hypothetical protein P0082_11220 [Candidatus Haliotispira prima]|uniref:Lipoprotein n=1 Tax=Candidatus Haliotispira prima TaxID=3034016 RepID=A0ABY8MJP3_9SPIO|nr:hypothetical protein P0082_11220 [Candidatus Haliotispira prima]
MKHIAVFSLLLLSSGFFSCGEIADGYIPCGGHRSFSTGPVGYSVEIADIPDRSKIEGFNVVYSEPENLPPRFGPVLPDKKFLSASKQTPGEGQETGSGSSHFGVRSPWSWYCIDREAIEKGYIPIADKVKIPYLSFILTYDGTVYDGGPLLKYRYGQMEVDRDKIKEVPIPEDYYYYRLDLGAGRYTVRFSDLEKNELKEKLEIKTRW